MATLCIEGFGGFVASTAAPIATGWSDESCRAGLAPAEDPRLSRRTRKHALFDLMEEIPMIGIPIRK